MLLKAVRTLIIFGLVGNQAVFAATDKLKDFRGTQQKAVLLGLSTEFVEPAIEEKITEQIRRLANRYTRSYGASSIASFNLQQNSGKTFFRPSTGALPEPQKKFLVEAAKANAIDIFILGTFREVGEDYEVELQLYDHRIDTLSAIERSQFSRATTQASLEQVVYKLMNYLDRDGFVHPQPQEFLVAPDSLRSISPSGGMTGMSGTPDDLSVNPVDLSSGYLAGSAQVGGEKTPFWETWWFWTLVGGGLATAGGLSYYFLVVDEPSTRANITFVVP